MTPPAPMITTVSGNGPDRAPASASGGVSIIIFSVDDNRVGYRDNERTPAHNVSLLLAQEFRKKVPRQNQVRVGNWGGVFVGDRDASTGDNFTNLQWIALDGQRHEFVGDPERVQRR